MTTPHLKSKFLFFIPLFCLCSITAEDFKMDTSGQNLRIDFRGRPLITGSSFTSGETEQLTGAVKTSSVTLPDGSQVYNVWNDTILPFRQEAAINADGSEVEISFQMEVDAWHPAIDGTGKRFRLLLPFSEFENLHFKSYTGQRRLMREISGTVKPGAKGKIGGVNHSFLNIYDDHDRSIVFDFNPAGLGNYIGIYRMNCIRGEWEVIKSGDNLIFQISFLPPSYGASIAAKVKIFAGTLQDYDKRHALRSFGYPDQMPSQYQFAFGATRHGKNYKTVGDSKFTGECTYGWLNSPKLQTNTGYREGVLYSNLSGEGNAIFKMTNLPNGIHILTLSAGNYTGIANNFSVKCNGKEVVQNLNIPQRMATVITIPATVDNGSMELEFDGKFQVSSLSTQFLMAESEDFSVKRGFWRSDAFEPSVLFRNEHYRPAPTFSAALDSFELPVPGKEAVDTPKKLERPVEFPSKDSMDWRYSSVIAGLGPGNSGTFQEFSNEEKLERRLDELEKQRIGVVCVNGMLSRHTYIGHEERVRREIRKITAAAHKRGMKVIDHQDLTLLWNLDAGFRVMAERSGELNKVVRDNTVSWQFCLLNPEMNRQFFDKAVQLVRETDIDGMMVDEVIFWKHGCGCGICRKRFYEDTGCMLPANELSKDLYNRSSPLWKTWLEWRKVQVGNWNVQLRRAINTVKKDFTLLGYTTHYGFITNDSINYGRDLVEKARGLDFIGTEIMPRNPMMTSRATLPYRKAKNMLRFAYNTPIYGLVYPDGDWNVAYFGWAMNNMNAQVTWHISEIKQPRQDVPDFVSFTKEHGNMDMKLAEPIAEVALLFSSQSRDWNSRLRFHDELFGTAQTLENMHIPYQFIGEMSLTPESLKQFKVLFLAASGCLSDEQIKVIKDFVSSGGTVHLTTITGLFNEVGQTRSQWAFADIFGFDINPKSSKATDFINPIDGQVIRFSEPITIFRTAPPQKVAADSLLNRVAGKAKTQVIITRKHGKGTFHYQTSALASPLTASEKRDQKWGFEVDRQLYDIYSGVLRKVIGNASVWQIQAPENVYTTLYRQGNQTIAHFLNATAVNPGKDDIIKSGAPKPPFPSLKNDIVFSLPLKKLNKAWAVSPDFSGQQNLKFRKLTDNIYEITLPKELLKAYTLVYME